MSPGRHLWIQVATGAVALGEEILGEGDGAAVSAEDEVRISGHERAQVLVFDLD